MQVDQDEAGSVIMECKNVEPGHLYPEEVRNILAWHVHECTH